MTPQSAIEPTTTTYPQSRRTTTTTCDRGVVLEVDASEVQQKYSLDTRSNQMKCLLGDSCRNSISRMLA